MRWCLIGLFVAVASPIQGTASRAGEVAAALGAEPSPAATQVVDKPVATAPVPTLRVAAVQMRSSRNVQENVDKIKKALENCAKNGAQVVVFPECSLTGYFEADYMKSLSADDLVDAQRQVAAACREHKVYAIVGMPWRDGGKLYNSAVVIDSLGTVVERYHKIHLAESWPDGGDHLSVFKVDGTPCSIIVCHDERYPELVRLPVLAGARCIFYVSHESDLKQEKKIVPYRAQLQARAVENSVFVVQANAPANPDATGSHGQSRVVAPDGNIVEEATMFGEDVLIATLQLNQATGNMARGSAQRGPLADWWREGIKRVRIIGSEKSGSTVGRD